MNVIQDFLAVWPLAQLIIEILYILIPLALFLAYSGTSFISVFAKILAQIRQRSSFEKCARQLAQFGLILGWALLVGSRIWLFLVRAGADKSNDFAFAMLEVSWFLLALSVLATSLYYMLWQRVSRYFSLKIGLGVLSGILSCCALSVVLVTSELVTTETIHFFLNPDFVKGPSKNIDLWDTVYTIFYIFRTMWRHSALSLEILLYSPPLVIVFSAGFGALWLFIRRKYEDFGRDHYNIMIAWCARLCRNAWALLWCLLLMFTLKLCYQIFYGDIGGNIWLSIGTQAAYLFFWIIPGLLWAFVGRSSVALRCLFSLLLALLLAGMFLIPYFFKIF